MKTDLKWRIYATFFSLALFCAIVYAHAASETNAAKLYSLGMTQTNYVTNVIRTIRIEPVTTPCPECTGPSHPDHHERHIDYAMVYGSIYLSIETAHQGVKRVLLDTTKTNFCVVTNIVLRSWTQPGWTGPPTPMQ